MSLKILTLGSKGTRPAPPKSSWIAEKGTRHMPLTPTSGRTRRTVLVAVALTVVSLAPLASGAAPAKAALPAVRFAPNVVVDPGRLGGEPSMVVDSKNNIYISSIAGFSNSTSFLWKSEDGGESFDLLRVPAPTEGAGANAFLPGAGTLDAPFTQRPSKTLGGGDTTLIVGPPAPGKKDDALIFIDLEGLASFGSAASLDGGNTFINDNVFASGNQPVGDRQWGATWRDRSGTDHYYNFFNGLGGATAVSAGTGAVPEYAIIETTDYGKTWTDWKRGVTTYPGRSRPGPLFIDAKTGDLLLTWTYTSGTTGGAGFTRCTQAKVCTDTLVAKMPNYDTNNTFVSGARDRAGNLYVAWSAIPRGKLDPATVPTRIYMATSHTNGKTWSKPIVVSGSLPTASMPSIIAGDEGRVSLVYYATPQKGDPNFNSGPWYVYMSQSINAAAAKPAFSVTRISDHTNHINPICTAGTACAADKDRSNDRNLIDFLYAAPGPNGETMVTWADTANQIGPNPPKGPSITMFAKQVAGPSLYAKPGILRTPGTNTLEYSGGANRVGRYAPVNWRADGYDGHVPRHGPTGRGAENTSLDITAAYLEPAGATAMRGVIKLRDAFNIDVPSPYSNNFYMFWWWSNNKVHYAAAEVGPAGSGVSGSENPVSDCYAGEPSYSNRASTRYALYPATSVPPPAVTRISCAIDLQGGKLTMNIPLEAVGAALGDTLYSVTASSSVILQPTTAFNVVADLPEEIDGVAPFTYRVGQARLQRRL